MTKIDHLLFNKKEGLRRKKKGMAASASATHPQLDLARSIARALAAKKGRITIDDVGMAMWERHRVPTLGKAYGSVFRTSDFEKTGEYRQSVRKSSHARPVAVWRLAQPR